MHNDTYIRGVTRALLNSPHLTPQTRDALQQRLAKGDRTQPRFFKDEQFRLLEAVCNCLYPPEPHQHVIPLAMMLEEELATGAGKGWRFDSLPPLQDMFLQGLQGIDDEALAVFSNSFAHLLPAGQEQILRAVQQGRTTALCWKLLSPQQFFTELLATVTELYYSHPETKDAIGDVSFADLPGWQHIGLNGFDGREPQPGKSDHNE